MNPWVVKLAAMAAKNLARRQAVRLAARRFGAKQAAIGAAGFGLASRLVGGKKATIGAAGRALAAHLARKRGDRK